MCKNKYFIQYHKRGNDVIVTKIQSNPQGSNGVLIIQPSHPYYTACAEPIIKNSQLIGIQVSMDSHRPMSTQTGRFHTGAIPDRYLSLNVNNLYTIGLAFDDDQYFPVCNQFIKELDGKYVILFNHLFLKFLSRQLKCELTYSDILHDRGVI
jgi:hypothetical protein